MCSVHSAKLADFVSGYTLAQRSASSTTGSKSYARSHRENVAIIINDIQALICVFVRVVCVRARSDEEHTCLPAGCKARLSFADDWRDVRCIIGVLIIQVK